jgi:hypothetical protein
MDASTRGSWAALEGPSSWCKVELATTRRRFRSASDAPRLCLSFTGASTGESVEEELLVLLLLVVVLLLLEEEEDELDEDELEEEEDELEPAELHTLELESEPVDERSESESDWME